MRGLLAGSFLFLHFLQNCAQNITREEKFLSVFTVVKFSNDACGSTSGLNGTCYTSSQCESLGGSSSGACASSFGVCCVFTLACGGTSSQNNTYMTMTSYTVSTDPDPCLYTICKASSDICKLRIDYETMTIAGPGTVDLTSTTASLTDSPIVGDCITDSLTITNPAGSSPPVICGINTGQHMFVPASEACNQLKFDIDTGSSATTRSWQLKVTQYECGSQMAPEQECLQYFTADTGEMLAYFYEQDEVHTIHTLRLQMCAFKRLYK